MNNADITNWANHCFETRENGVQQDDVRIYHPLGRDTHRGVLVFAFMVDSRFLQKDAVTWCFVDRADFNKWNPFKNG